MATQDVKGIWLSRYEYSRGPADEVLASKHRIEFAREGNKWVGTSLPDEEGSEVRFELTQNGKEFGGSWRERTSPSGDYKGYEFSGLILFRLSDNGQELNGMWLGAGSRSGRVKSGVWTLRKES
jgi:hypothetical protein